MKFKSLFSRNLFYATIAILLVVLAVGALDLYHKNALLNAPSATKTIFVGTTPVQVSLAITPAERSRGLSGHAPLGPSEGMLFVFDRDGAYAFWMKDMLFSIDMVWIAADGTIVYIKENATPESYPTAFTPPVPARYVLELPSGFSRVHVLKVGDKIRL